MSSIKETIIENAVVCRDDSRRIAIMEHQTLNGIDFVEYQFRFKAGKIFSQHVLVVHFLKPLPTGAYKLPKHLEWVKIEGGVKVVGIKILSVVEVDHCLEVIIDQPGDFSIYWLYLGWKQDTNGNWRLSIPELEEQFSRAPVNFKAGCPVDFDCKQTQVCPPEQAPEPLIDYLAKDYASFRQLLLDSIPQLNPDWLERNPADLGITLVELLAYAGDHLSYFQDAVANEAYLDTARQRLSAKRHARLVDYHMHDGRNAWTFVYVKVFKFGVLGKGTQFLTRIAAPLQGQYDPPEIVIDPLSAERFESDPALARSVVFESAFNTELYPENNEIFIHSWGDLNCCLPRGVTDAYLYSVDSNKPSKVISPRLVKGDYLLFEEIRGPLTGESADANHAHRQVVRIICTEDAQDSLYTDYLKDGRLSPRGAKDPKLKLLHVTWRREDALCFPLCLSKVLEGDDPILNISVARGNLILADHGRTVSEALGTEDSPPRLRLGKNPLTIRFERERNDVALLHGRETELSGVTHEAAPAIRLVGNTVLEEEAWISVPDLLDSQPFDPHFVVDVDQDGYGTLRFGDGVYGREPSEREQFTAIYRIGSGRAGNIGAEALYHVIPMPSVGGNFLSESILSVRNPLAAEDGTDSETIEEVRQYAPAAFRAVLLRAVTEQDYIDAAMKMPDIAGAMAAFRWTGSWYTVLVAVDPWDSVNLIILPGGNVRLTLDFEARVRDFITRYKLAGYELDVRAAEYVPLEINLNLCVAPTYFRGDVVLAVRAALSNRVNPDGSRGFFHSDNFSFGQEVYLSRLYAAILDVTGVASAVVTCFRRFRTLDTSALESGMITMGTWEIARLDNDPNFMEFGVLRINLGGGK